VERALLAAYGRKILRGVAAAGAISEVKDLSSVFKTSKVFFSNFRFNLRGPKNTKGLQVIDGTLNSELSEVLKLELHFHHYWKVD